MTATFLLPLAIGATKAISSADNILSLAYGLVATVALMPLITIQLLGFTGKLKRKYVEHKNAQLISKINKEDIIEFE